MPRPATPQALKEHQYVVILGSLGILIGALLAGMDWLAILALIPVLVSTSRLISIYHYEGLVREDGAQLDRPVS